MALIKDFGIILKAQTKVKPEINFFLYSNQKFTA
jgi:hypothetical protein